MAKRKSRVRMAKSVQVFTCEHGSLWVRFNGKDGRGFAAACMDLHVGIRFREEVVAAVNQAQCATLTSGRCEGHA